MQTKVFPFGQPVLKVEQKDRTPKRVFVLGVYSSAVHARWISPEGRIVVNALAVASEPDIFWRGGGAAEIIEQINIPPALGKLTPARFNGPSGDALDKSILKPLGLNRVDAWLCDLVPYSCKNDSQAVAIERAYTPLIEKFGLPVPTIRAIEVVRKQLTDDQRRREILDELILSQAKVLILLGDEPIKWFLRHFDSRWQRLSDFNQYGRLHEITVDGNRLMVLPLAHPRQIAKLGRSSLTWFDAHQAWANDSATHLLI